MEFLQGAVAYRHDFTARERWANARKESVPVGCPCGCIVEYDLLVSEQADQSEVAAWIDVLHKRMEHQHPNHEETVFF